MRTRLRESARARAVGSLGFSLLLLLAGPAGLAAQETRPFPGYHLLPPESRDYERWMVSAQLGTVAPPLTFAESAATLEQPEAEVPQSAFLERHRTLFSALTPVASVALVTANSLIGYDLNHRFHVHHEGLFGADTVDGGADKASHLVDYFILTQLFEDVYRMLGYSEKEAIFWGVGVALVTGLANELGDGFTRHGFSPEDLAMDAAGATAAALVSLTRTRDLVGLRTSHLAGDTYTHDVYSGDLKLSGVGKRLGVNIGPLRWLLLSVTYGTKGYRVSPPIQEQRQLGFEIGLNLQQILFDVGVSRNTWWGYPLHLVADNIRFPYTAVGMRVDLNRGKWHGPNSGNFE